MQPELQTSLEKHNQLTAITKENFYPQPQLTPLQHIKTHPNYISQYFQRSALVRIPQINLTFLHDKIGKLKTVFSGQISDINQFLEQEYELDPPILLNQQLCSHPQKLQQKLNALRKQQFELIWHDGQLIKTLYYGQKRFGKKHGYGIYAEYCENNEQKTIVYFYEGFFEDNYKHGFGCQMNHRTIYLGSFINNEQFSQGESVMLFPNGDLYVGGVLKGKSSGKGAYFKHHKSVNQIHQYQASTKSQSYEAIVLGYWQENTLIQSTNCMMHTGMKQIFSMDLRKAQINLLIVSSSVYCGDIRQSDNNGNIAFIREGKGFEYFNNGDIYKGEYCNDRPHGQGYYIWSNEQQYLGQFCRGTRQGKGKWTGSNKQTYEGEYKGDKKNGYGIYKWPNGQCFEGQFLNDLRDGYGLLTLNNSDFKEGYWKQGVFQSQTQPKSKTNFHSLIKKSKILRKFQNSSQPNPIPSIQPQRTKTNIFMNQADKKANSLDRLQTNKISLLRQKGNKMIQRNDRRSQEQLKPLKFFHSNQQPTKQQKQHSSIHSFFNPRNLTVLQQLKQKNQQESQQNKTDPTTKKQTIQDSEDGEESRTNLEPNMTELENNRTQQNIWNKRRTATDHTLLKKKVALAAKIKAQKLTKTRPESILGETLLKPIKWRNFGQSWQHKYI